MKIKYKLIGSASSLDKIIGMIKDSWFWSEVNLTPIDANTWSVASGKGLMDRLRVVLKRGRYRFERIDD